MKWHGTGVCLVLLSQKPNTKNGMVDRSMSILSVGTTVTRAQKNNGFLVLFETCLVQLFRVDPPTERPTLAVRGPRRSCAADNAEWLLPITVTVQPGAESAMEATRLGEHPHLARRDTAYTAITRTATSHLYRKDVHEKRNRYRT